MASTLVKLTGRSVVSLCLPGRWRPAGAGAADAAAARPVSLAAREVAAKERALQAPPVAVARVDAYDAANASAAHGAGHQTFGQQKTQIHTMWALRGLHPWSDPA